MEYEVIVGNIGKVCETDRLTEAVNIYDEYVKISKLGKGRAGHEDVTLLKWMGPFSRRVIEEYIANKLFKS